jgi:4a-hydroxytetrahydrobiopterin dehydratase
MIADWKRKELLPDKNPKILSNTEIQDFLLEFSDWRLVTDQATLITKLTREIKFSTFLQAFGYLSQIALLSEKLDHHAEIYNSYNLVTLRVFTHTSLKITSLDRIFAYHAEKMI